MSTTKSLITLYSLCSVGVPQVDVCNAAACFLTEAALGHAPVEAFPAVKATALAIFEHTLDTYIEYYTKQAEAKANGCAGDTGTGSDIRQSDRGEEIPDADQGQA